MSVRKYVIEKDGTFWTPEGVTVHPEEGTKFDTSVQASEIIQDRGLVGFSAQPYVFYSYRATEIGLPNVRELTLQSRNISQDDFDNLLSTRLGLFIEEIVAACMRGELVCEFEIEVPVMKKDRLTLLCKNSTVFKLFTGECEKIHAWFELSIPAVESVIRLTCRWSDSI